MPKTEGPRSYAPSSYLVAAAICLCPIAAGAQTYNPNASDGVGNTAAGTNALSAGAGLNNTAAGYSALALNTTGTSNTAAGSNALFANDTGSDNTAIGAGALSSSSAGSYNTAAGRDALASNTIGNHNLGFGYKALVNNATGNNNVAIGARALLMIEGGKNNIALGSNAGSNTKKGNNNIYIGHRGIKGIESRVTRIGKVQTKVFVAGIAGVPGNGAHVVVRANGQLGTVVSSARYKQDIEPLDDMAGKLAKLRPVSFRYKTEPQATHYGLIAEEVATTMPELVVRDGKNRPDSVQYMELVPLLLQQWKAQQAAIMQQRELIAQQRARLERQEAKLAALRHMLDTRLAKLDDSNREN